uniref:C1q domain-containing protein n=1 Tax=Xiphophorus couchianus TaxID=32473 RepID=A0A3B5LWF7_9TELE
TIPTTYKVVKLICCSSQYCCPLLIIISFQRTQICLYFSSAEIQIIYCLSVKRVAFSASLLDLGSNTFGPFNTFTTLVFRNVVTNIGNAYNRNSGFFVAPVKGAYHFEFYICGPGSPSHLVSAVLVRNGEHIFIATETQPSHLAAAGNAATLLLEVGDVVFIRQYENSRISDSQNRHTTFSGHLLFTM